MHLYAVTERENGTQEKNTEIFCFFLQQKKKKKNQIKCYFKILAALSLFSPETKSDNENGDKAILGIIAD